MTINMEVISGKGDGTVDITGFNYIKVKTSAGPIRIEYVNDGHTSMFPYFGSDNEVIVPAGVTSITVKAHSSVTWWFELWNTRPAINQTELKISLTDDGCSVTGDEYICYIGEKLGTPADISGLRINMDGLQRLFGKALSTHSADDAATYLQYKTRVLELVAAGNGN
ncbi:hypothetical protein [Paenibacillus soyae]|uniref:Uncharacterized protein n=1 Tax=Paenibacillus soyae TaxID=2969249 RepID=A0A9X2MS33_9BACL|nr:hypothetical protein [Paenibacillus soyae]MCR2805335.1 hypothetical protein [Paenibacillus soyae]